MGVEALDALLKDSDLNADEKANLFSLWARSHGITDASLAQVALAPGAQRATSLISEQEIVLSSSYKQVILVLSPYPYHSRSLTFIPEIQAGILRAAESLHYQVVMRCIDRADMRSLHDYALLPEQLVGVIAITCHVRKSTWLDDCRQLGLPLVLIHDKSVYDQSDHDTDEDPDESVVSVQNLLPGTKVASIAEDLEGLREMTRHLVLHHHRRQLRIVIAHHQEHPLRKRKLVAIKTAAEKAHVLVDLDKHVRNVQEYTYLAGHNLVDMDSFAMDLDAGVGTVICLQDRVALGVRDALTERKKRGIIVAGYDNSWIAQAHKIPTVDRQLQTAGRRAVVIIHDALQGQVQSWPHKETEIRTSFISGDCCDN